MGAGQLKARLQFQSPKAASDGYGNEEEGWQEEQEVSAQIIPLKGGEQVLAQRLSGTQPVVIRVRSSSFTRGIGADWRAVDVHSDAIYQVKAPPADMDQKRQYLDILAEQGVAA